MWGDGILFPPSTYRNWAKEAQKGGYWSRVPKHTKGRPFVLAFNYEQGTFGNPPWQDVNIANWLVDYNESSANRELPRSLSGLLMPPADASSDPPHG